MSIPASRYAHRDSRLPKVVCVVVALALIGVIYATTGGFGLEAKVVIGRIWPTNERLPLDQIRHDTWDSLLRRYVDESGRVDYAAWRESTADQAALDAYLALLSRGDPARDVPRTARLAFWINAYNALTIRGILREHPTSSIQNHVSHLGGYNIWRDLLLIVGDEAYSLGQIEHVLLRPLHEPRIHFAIVCGSRGCPRLRQSAYVASDLDQQLNENARAFFADPEKLNFDSSRGELRLSPILKWYADDFGTDQASVLKAITPFLRDEMARRLRDRRGVRIDYADHDWGLNGKDSAPDHPPIPPDE